MTIFSSTFRTDWLAADGSNKDWSYAFSLEEDDVVIEVRNAAGDITTFTSNYEFFPTDAESGFVRYPSVGAALAAGNHVRISRLITYTQPTEIGNQGRFHPEIHERAFDRATIQIQQLKDFADRSPKVPAGSLAGVWTVGAEDEVIVFDADGGAKSSGLTTLQLGASEAAAIAAAAAAAASELEADADRIAAELAATEAAASAAEAASILSGAVLEADTSTAAMQFVIDEDTMASNLATKVPTQQSVKAYTDSRHALTVKTADTSTAAMQFVIDEDSMASDSATKVPTQQSVKAYVDANSGDTPEVATRTELKALDTANHTSALLTESGRAGLFLWRNGDYSAKVTADTQEGIYIKADAVATTSGAWIRDCDLRTLDAAWFGLTADLNTWTAAVTSVAGTPNITLNIGIFTASRVGKRIMIDGIGPGGVPLAATILSSGSSTTAVLSSNASVSLTASSGKRVKIGTDNTAAIQAAIDNLPASGGTVLIAGPSAISSTITVGDGTAPSGSAGSYSTRYGVRLLGKTYGNNTDPALYPLWNSASNELSWLGAYNTSVVVAFMGYMEGFEISNFTIEGNNLARGGLWLEGASFGRTDNLRIRNCVAAHYYCMNVVQATGQNIRIDMGVTEANAYGFVFDGRTDGSVSSYGITLTDVQIWFNPAIAQRGFYYGVSDSVTINDVIMISLTAAHASSIGVLFDYGRNPLFPCNLVFNKPDVGYNIPVARQWLTAGAPAGGAGQQFINNLAEINGGRWPSTDTVGNLSLSLPHKVAQKDLNAASGAVASTGLYTFKIASIYRVSYAFSIRTVGTAGTITPAFSYTGIDGVGRNVFAPSVTVTSTANAANGSFLIAGNPGGGINYQLGYTGVTGTPVYDFNVTIERLN